jgi:hypothetical protein
MFCEFSIVFIAKWLTYKGFIWLLRCDMEGMTACNR